MISEQDEVLLQAYLDGELAPEEVARVELRLANSAEWRRAEEELRELLGHGAQYFAVLDDDDPALQRTLSEEQAREPVGAQAAESAVAPVTPGNAPGHTAGVTPIAAAASRRRAWRVPAFALAAAALLVAIGLGTFGSDVTPDGSIVASGGPEQPAPSPVPTSPPDAPVPGDGATDSVTTAPVPDDAVAPVPAGPGDSPPQPPRTPPRPERPPPDPRTDARTIRGIELAGLTPASSTVDTTFGMRVLRETYEIRPDVEVTLEAVESDAAVATRGSAGGSRSVDTTAVVQPVEKGLALVWRLPSGVTLRLQGDVSEAELRLLRERVRVSGGRQP